MTTELLGRLHPILLHLPIGIYAAAVIAAFLAPRRVRGDRSLLTALLWTSFASALPAAAAGWLLARSGNYRPEEFETHQWTGIAFCAMTGVHLLLHVRNPLPRWERAMRNALFASTSALMAVTGHLGGTITHGEGYLKIWPRAQEEGGKAADTAGAAQAPSVYSNLVYPVLHTRCEPCHRQGKSKGGLRMDGYGMLMRGGRNGKVVVPGDTLHSELLLRTMLPEEDEKHMPPKGRPQLTEEEKQLLRWWVGHGAKQDAPLSAYNPGAASAGIARDSTKPYEGEPHTPLPAVPEPDSSAIAALRRIGFSVKPVAADSRLLEVSAVNMRSLTDGDLRAIGPLAENVLWLTLSDKPVSDAGLALLSPCRNLRRLDLRNTPVGNAAAASIGRLRSLEYLNLSGTRIDDGAMAVTDSLPALRRLYLWNTGVSATAAEDAMRRMPGLRVVRAAQ